MKRLSFFVLLLLISCRQEVKDFELRYVEVFYVSFGINFPVDIGDRAVGQSIPYIIKDESTLTQIESMLRDVVKLQEKYRPEDIYLRCILHCTDGKSFIMDYNKSQIRLNGVWYEDHPELVDLILGSK